MGRTSHKTMKPLLKAIMPLAMALASGAVAGAQDKVSAEDMNKGLVNSSLDALNGRSAGVTISRTGSETMLNTVRVRGTTSLTGGNDPLVIIDGVSSDLSVLNTIYPADIESFTILKDAAETASYGSRGASGVILVTTRKGSDGGFRIGYDGAYGFETVSRRLKMMNASEYLSACAAAGLSAINGGHDSDFQRAITRTGTVMNHHLSFGGGSEEGSYRASVGVMDHRLVVRTNDSRNYYAKIDISQKAFGDLAVFNLGLTGSLRKMNLLHDTGHLFYSAAAFNPTYSTDRNASGEWDQIPSASQINNPLSLLEKKYYDENGYFNVHMESIWEAGEFSFRALGSYSYNSGNSSQYFPTSVWAQGQAYRGESHGETLLGNLSGRWDRGFDQGRQNIGISLMAEWQRKMTKGFCTTVNNFTTDRFGYDNLMAGADRLWGGTGSFFRDPRLLSFMASADYSFMELASLKGSIRADASSKFGKNHKWGYFPSISGTLHLKPLLGNLAFVNTLDINTGYGLSGNQDALDPYNSLPLLSPAGIVSVNGANKVTMGYVRNPNPDLKWEVRKSFNAGMSGTFLDSRLSVAVDVYLSKTCDMLYDYDVSVPPFLFDKLTANLGSMRNNGVEIGIGGILLRTQDIELNAVVNLSFQSNKLLSLSGWYNGEYISAPDMVPLSSLNGAGLHGGYNSVVYQIVGQPLGVFYLPHCTGLVDNGDGTFSYGIEDINGGGVSLADGEDRRVAGQAMPKAILGSNFSLRVRNWDLSIQLNGAFGHKIYNGTALSYTNLGSLPYYNAFKSVARKKINDLTATDFFLEKGDYVNIDYLTVGRAIPLKNSRVRNLRISLSVNNPATFTCYSGLTPMINSSAADGTLGLDDKNCYPVYRSYTLGLSMQF